MVAALCRIHSTGNVVGTLGMFSDFKIVLDFQDNVMLLALSAFDFKQDNKRVLLSPERRFRP